MIFQVVEDMTMINLIMETNWPNTSYFLIKNIFQTVHFIMIHPVVYTLRVHLSLFAAQIFRRSTSWQKK